MLWLAIKIAILIPVIWLIICFGILFIGLIFEIISNKINPKPLSKYDAWIAEDLKKD